MPFLKIQTNTNISPEQTEALLEQGTQLIVETLSKPMEYVQVMVEGGQSIAFAGSEDPSAFVELRSLGLPGDSTSVLSAAISALLEERLEIPANRVFINFFDIERSQWGWNGETFG